MLAFREDAERDAVLKCLYNYFFCVLVLQDITQTVSLADHRKDTEEEHDLCNKLDVEHVCPCTENCLLFVCPKYHKSIHECVAVVWSKDYSSVCRDIFLSFDCNSSITLFDVPVYYRP